MSTLVALLLATWSPGRTSTQGRWQEIGTTRSGNPVFVERKSVHRNREGLVVATIRVVFTTPVKSPQGNLTASRATATFDCAHNSFAALENTTYFDEKQNRVFAHNVNKQPGFGPAIAGTFADVALEHFCAK